MSAVEGGGRRFVVATVVALFVVFHSVMFGWIVPADAWRSGGDLDTYLDPAVGLYRHGAFVEPNDPKKASLYRLPLYSIVVAVGLMMTGGDSPRPALLANLAILLATGLLTWRVASTWVPRMATVVLALVLFNPLAIGTAYILQPLNLNALWFALAGWLLLRDKRPPNTAEVLALGCVTGLAALTRPAGQILIATLPIGVPLIAYLMGDRSRLRHQFAVALAASALAAIIIAPWMFYAQANGQGFRLSSVEHNTLFLSDNNSGLEMHTRGGSLQDAKARVQADLESWRSTNVSSLDTLDPAGRQSATNSYLIGRLFDYPAFVVAKAWSIALANLYVGGGTANLQMALGIEAPKAWDKVRDQGFNYVTAFFAAIAEAPLGASVVSALCVGFALLCRLAGLIGVVVALRRRDWAPLAMTMAFAAYFAIIHLFVGESIYRVPIEPYLILLAVYGIEGILERFRRTS